jgi:hypothetical protein
VDFIDFGALVPVVAILASIGFAFIWLRYHELKVTRRQLELEAGANAQEKRALQERLAVLERIVTDRGVQTADQIEALRGMADNRGGSLTMEELTPTDKGGRA